MIFFLFYFYREGKFSLFLFDVYAYFFQTVSLTQETRRKKLDYKRFRKNFPNATQQQVSGKSLFWYFDKLFLSFLGKDKSVLVRLLSALLLLLTVCLEVCQTKNKFIHLNSKLHVRLCLHIYIYIYIYICIYIYIYSSNHIHTHKYIYI